MYWYLQSHQKRINIDLLVNLIPRLMFLLLFSNTHTGFNFSKSVSFNKYSQETVIIIDLVSLLKKSSVTNYNLQYCMQQTFLL